MAIALTGQRVHELALQAWFYRRFFVADGYPIPFLLTAPHDAYSQFQNLWGGANGPFSYLLNAKDPHTGEPLYQPYPTPAPYPLISVHRKGWSFRPQQSYSIHRKRHINWPTVENNPTREALSLVTTAQWPSAWNYQFQVDHFCMRPDQQAYFLDNIFAQFWRSGGEPQTWLPVVYPGYLGERYVRMKMDSSINNLTPEEVDEGEVTIYRTGLTLTIEGYAPDLDLQQLPAFWTLVLTNTLPATPAQLASIYSISTDLRPVEQNGALDSAPNVPDSGLKPPPTIYDQQQDGVAVGAFWDI